MKAYVYGPGGATISDVAQPKPEGTQVLVRVRACGLNRADTDKFVGMYVNQLTLDYGDRGRAALDRFLTEAFEKKLIPVRVPVEFV